MRFAALTLLLGSTALGDSFVKNNLTVGSLTILSGANGCVFAIKSTGGLTPVASTDCPFNPDGGIVFTPSPSTGQMLMVTDTTAYDHCSNNQAGVDAGFGIWQQPQTSNVTGCAGGDRPVCIGWNPTKACPEPYALFCMENSYSNTEEIYFEQGCACTGGQHILADGGSCVQRIFAFSPNLYDGHTGGTPQWTVDSMTWQGSPADGTNALVPYFQVTSNPAGVFESNGAVLHQTANNIAIAKAINAAGNTYYDLATLDNNNFWSINPNHRDMWIDGTSSGGAPLIVATVGGGDGYGEPTVQVNGDFTLADATLGTCSSNRVGSIVHIGGGGTTSVPSYCICEAPLGNSVYQWCSITDATASVMNCAGGSTTVCPAALAAVTSVDSAWNAYDPITSVGTTNSFAQMGAMTTAATVRACTYTPFAAAVGTGTETIELCDGTGITTGNCTGTKFCTCSLTSGSSAFTPVVCTVNTSAMSAGANPTWTITASTIATTDATGNATFKWTNP
jgi:hypothetical protein